MGVLTETGLDNVVRAGCPACGPGVLTFRAFLDGRQTLLQGEPVGKLVWVYDGEKFVDGVFEITCAACERVILQSDLCPRCHSEGGLQRALTRENGYPLLAACPRCEGEEVRYVALLPAWVNHDGKRASPPKTHTEYYDPGFHGARVECRDCGVVAEQTATCPLCAAPGPLRARPG